MSRIPVRLGAKVSFSIGELHVRGVVDATAAQPYKMTSYLVNGQWYSDPNFELVRIPNVGNLGITRYVDKFFKIPLTIPRYYLDMIGYTRPDSNRYVAIYYQGSKAVWCDGSSFQTFSYFSAYQPLVEHFAVAYYLLNAHLGYDDSEATHALLLDCCNPDAIEIRIGTHEEVIAFTNSAIPKPKILKPLTLEELQTLAEKYIASLDSSNEAFRKMGLFEIFCGQSAKQKDFTYKFTKFLDAQITPELIRACIRAGQDNHKAEYLLFELQTRIAQSCH